MLKPYYIYVIINKLTGKYYVGKTTSDVAVRWGQHVKDSKNPKKIRYFHRAIRKYGSCSFEARTLFECFDEKTLESAEIFFISLLQATNENFGYNTTFGGEGGKKTEIARKNMSLAKKGKPSGRKGKHLSDSWKLALSMAWDKEKHFTPEIRAKISAASKGKLKGPSGKIPHNKGIKASEELKKAMRDGWEKRKGIPTSTRGKPKSPEHVAAMRLAREKRKLQKETPIKESLLL